MSLLLLIFAFTISGCSSTNEEGLVAIVNNEEITEEEFESEFQMFKTNFERQYGEDFMEKLAENGETNEENLKKDIIEKLIIEKILYKEANDKKLTVLDEELKVQMDLQIDSVGGRESFDEYLEKNELTEEVFSENIRKKLLLIKHIKDFENATVIPDDEAKLYFESNKDEVVKVNVSRILVETEEEGKDILKRLGQGEDFGAIALIESRDSRSAMDGGNLGYFTRGILPVEVEEIVDSLKPGEISDLFKTDVGYQIIRLEDRKDTYEALEKDVKQLLVEIKYEEKLEELRTTAKVKFFGKHDKKQ